MLRPYRVFATTHAYGDDAMNVVWLDRVQIENGMRKVRGNRPPARLSRIASCGQVDGAVAYAPKDRVPVRSTDSQQAGKTSRIIERLQAY